MKIQHVAHTAAGDDPAGPACPSPSPARCTRRHAGHRSCPRRLPARRAPRPGPPPYRTELIPAGPARNVRG